MTRYCSRCGTERESDDFYAGSAQCKPCVRARVRQHRVKNLDAIRQYDRERGKTPERIANATRVTREWRRAHRDRLRAHNKAARTPIAKPNVCEGCGQAKPIEKHHPDYSRPLLVVWLCKPCHVIADKIRRKLETA